MTKEEIIKSIKREFRLGMNGVVSTSMREKGMDYKINFGLSLPQLRAIAEKFPDNEEVASYLWSEDIRESKLIASMIFPLNKMSFETAMSWIEEIRFYEVSDISTMFLFSKLVFAEKLITECINSQDENKLYFALRLFVRMLINKSEIGSETKSIVKNIASKHRNNNNMAIASIANDIIQRLEY